MRPDRLPRAAASLAAALFVALSSPSLHAQPTAPEAARFAELLNAAGEAPEGREKAAFRRVWDEIDSLALARLNAGTAPGGLDAVLAGLPGYAGPAEGNGVATENTIFYGSLPRDAPNYLAAPVRVGRDTLVLGLYSLMHNTPGRMSVYARRQGRWRRTGGYDAPLPISARLLFPADFSVVVVAFEDFVGGDRSEARVRLLRVARSGAVALVRAERGRLVDPRVEPAPGGVAVTWDSFPARLGAAVLGPRLTYRTTYRASGRRVAADTVALNPWVGVLETFFRRHEAGNAAAARALAADEAVYRAVARLGEEGAVRDGGDLERGEGWVDFTGGRRVVSRRGADGRWRVISVVAASPPVP